MAHRLPSMVRQTSTSTGLTTLVLNGAARKPYRSFASSLSNGDTTDVMVVDRATGVSQAAKYSYSGGTLTFVEFISSSTGEQVNFGAGTKDVYVSWTGARAEETLDRITALEAEDSYRALVPESYAAVHGRTVATAADIQDMLDDAEVRGLPVMFPAESYTLDEKIAFPAGTRVIGDMHFVLEAVLTNEDGYDQTDLNEDRDIDIRFGDGCIGEGLYIACAGGVALNTFQVYLGDGCEFGFISLAADVQRTSSSTAVKSGGGVLTRGQDVRIGAFRSVNYDRPFYLRNEEVTPSTGFYCGFLDIESYVRGIRLDNCDGPVIGGFNMRVRSAGAQIGHYPGTNGILMQGVSNPVFGNGSIYDSGEHGIRVGGSTWNGDDLANQTKNVRFGVLHIGRTGCAAIKINPTVDGETCDGFHVAGLFATDIGDTANGGTLAPNMRVLRLSHARDVSFGFVDFRADTQTYLVGLDTVPVSAQAVIGLNDVDGLRIGFISGDPALAGIIIDETQDSDADEYGEGGDNSTGPVQNVTIDYFDHTPLVNGYLLTAATQYGIGNIFINGMKADSVITGIVNVSAATPVLDPIRINAEVRGGATKPVVTLGDATAQGPNVYVDVRWGAVRWVGSGTTATTPRGFSALECKGAVSDFTNVTTGFPTFYATTLDGTAAQWSYGASYGFSRIGSTRRAAAIAMRQTGTNDFNGGLEFRVGGASSSDALSKSMLLKHTGTLNMPDIQTFASNALAIAGGLAHGDEYKLQIGSDYVKAIVHNP
jgi:hypothetical protein